MQAFLGRSAEFFEILDCLGKDMYHWLVSVVHIYLYSVIASVIYLLNVLFLCVCPLKRKYTFIYRRFWLVVHTYTYIRTLHCCTHHVVCKVMVVVVNSCLHCVKSCKQLFNLPAYWMFYITVTDVLNSSDKHLTSTTCFRKNVQDTPTETLDIHKVLS